MRGLNGLWLHDGRAKRAYSLTDLQQFQIGRIGWSSSFTVQLLSSWGRVLLPFGIVLFHFIKLGLSFPYFCFFSSLSIKNALYNINKRGDQVKLAHGAISVAANSSLNGQCALGNVSNWFSLKLQGRVASKTKQHYTNCGESSLKR